MKKYYTIFWSLLILNSCTRDRLVTLDKVTPALTNEMFSSGESQKTSIKLLATPAVKQTVTTSLTQTIVGKKGTRVTFSRFDFSMPDGSSPKVPFDIELREMITPGDIILNGVQTVSNGRILSTGGQVYIKATKDGKDLVLNQWSQLDILIPAKKIDTQMSLFYGNENGTTGDVNWVAAPLDTARNNNRDSVIVRAPMTFLDSAYAVIPTQIGWINCDKFYKYEGAKTVVKVKSTVPSIDKLVVFLYLPEISSIISISNGVSLEIPVGQRIKIVAFAEDTATQQRYFFLEEMIAVDKLEVLIEVRAATREEILNALKTL